MCFSEFVRAIKCEPIPCIQLTYTHALDFLILLLLISYDIICGCVRGFFFSFQSMFDHDQTKFVLPQYTIKQKRCSNSSPHHLCFLAVNNIAWDAMCAKRIMFDMKVGRLEIDIYFFLNKSSRNIETLNVYEYNQ